MTKATRPRKRGVCVFPGCGRPVTVTLTRRRRDGFQRGTCSAAHASIVAGDFAFGERWHLEQMADLLNWIVQRARRGSA